MPSILFTNNAATTLASGITNVATSLTVAAGKGALFPTISGSDFFYATLANGSGGVEIVKVTARSTDTFTIVRGQDGTSGVAWNTGDKVELRVTAAAMGAMAQTANNLSDLASASTARTNLGVTATGSDTTYAYRANNLSDLASASTARTNLGAQATLVSGTNIKTINSTSLLGSGNIAITSSPGGSTTQVQYNSSGAFAGSANLTFDGTNLTCGGTVTANSDESLKTNWRGYSGDFVEQLAQIKHGTYDRIDVELTQDGVSAQSLQKLLPNSVLQNDDGILSVAYGNAALVSAIKLAERIVQIELALKNLTCKE